MTEGNNCEMEENTAGVTEIVEEEKGKRGEETSATSNVPCNIADREWSIHTTPLPKPIPLYMVLTSK